MCLISFSALRSFILNPSTIPAATEMVPLSRRRYSSYSAHSRDEIIELVSDDLRQPNPSVHAFLRSLIVAEGQLLSSPNRILLLLSPSHRTRTSEAISGAYG